MKIGNGLGMTLSEVNGKGVRRGKFEVVVMAAVCVAVMMVIRVRWAEGVTMGGEGRRGGVWSRL